MSLTKSEATVNEGTSAIYSCTLQDEDGDAIALSQLGTITLTYYNSDDGTIINSRTEQDVKNANNVAISSVGVLTWNIQPLDTIIVAGTTVPRQTERHTALFEWTWATTFAGRHELDLYIYQMDEVTLDIGTTLVTSWGGGTTNSYVGLTAANSFIRYSILDNSSWKTASQEQRTAAIIEASAQIDTRNYVGSRKYSTQLMEFPRSTNAAYPWNRTTATASTLSDSETRMKTDVEKATCHQALYLLKNSGTNQHTELSQAGVTSARRKVGPLEEEYRYGGGSAASTQQLLNAHALNFLSDWMSDRRAIRG